MLNCKRYEKLIIKGAMSKEKSINEFYSKQTIRLNIASILLEAGAIVDEKIIDWCNNCNPNDPMLLLFTNHSLKRKTEELEQELNSRKKIKEEPANISWSEKVTNSKDVNAESLAK